MVLVSFSEISLAYVALSHREFRVRQMLVLPFSTKNVLFEYTRNRFRFFLDSNSQLSFHQQQTHPEAKTFVFRAFSMAFSEKCQARLNGSNVILLLVCITKLQMPNFYFIFALPSVMQYLRQYTKWVKTFIVKLLEIFRLRPFSQNGIIAFQTKQNLIQLIVFLALHSCHTCENASDVVLGQFIFSSQKDGREIGHVQRDYVRTCAKNHYQFLVSTSIFRQEAFAMADVSCIALAKTKIQVK